MGDRKALLFGHNIIIVLDEVAQVVRTSNTGLEFTYKSGSRQEITSATSEQTDTRWGLVCKLLGFPQEVED